MSHILYLRLHAKDPMTFSVSEESLHMPTLEERKDTAQHYLEQFIYDGRDGTYQTRENTYIESPYQQLILKIGAERENFAPSEDMPRVIQAFEQDYNANATPYRGKALGLAKKLHKKILENRVNPLLDKFPSFTEFSYDNLVCLETSLPNNTKAFLRQNRVELTAHLGEPPTKEQAWNPTNFLMFANLYYRYRLCRDRTISASTRTTLITFLQNSGVDITASPTKETLGWGISAMDAYTLFRNTLTHEAKAMFLMAGCLSPASVVLYDA
jgi:hypothetical protein